MRLDNLKDYFETYILNFAPYKDKAIYSQIVSFLLNYYLNHSYETIPALFKKLYEYQEIPVELYDTILLSNGFPAEVVNKISIADKYILLYSFMDYNRYKGSVEIMKKISNSFSDVFNLYELFIDYKDNVGWVFIPYPISVNVEYEIPEYFDFEPVANATRNFFITTEYLDELKQSSDILFPIKTNLLFTDYKNIEEYNEINKLIFSVVFNHFKDYRLILYFDKGQYQTSFEVAYKTWYYIFLKLYKFQGFQYISNDDEILPLVYNVLSDIYYYPNGDFSNKQKLTINNLSEMLEEYANISKIKKVEIGYHDDRKLIKRLKMGRTELTNFYKTYFFKLRQSLNTQDRDVDYLISKYIKQLPDDLVSYIDTMLDFNLSKNDLLLNASILLDSIKKSLITWSYSFEAENILKYNKFLLSFLTQLPFIKVKFNQTTSYHMLNFLKPYHAELINSDDYILKVKNKFNQVFIDDWKYTLDISCLEVTVETISQMYSVQLDFENQDSTPIIHSAIPIPIVRYDKKDNNISYDYYSSVICHYTTLILLSNYVQFITNLKDSEYNSITDTLQLINNLIVKHQGLTIDSTNSEYSLVSMKNILSLISDYNLFFSSYPGKNQVLISDRFNLLD